PVLFGGSAAHYSEILYLLKAIQRGFHQPVNKVSVGRIATIVLEGQYGNGSFHRSGRGGVTRDVNPQAHSNMHRQSSSCAEPGATPRLETGRAQRCCPTRLPLSYLTRRVPVVFAETLTEVRRAAEPYLNRNFRTRVAGTFQQLHRPTQTEVTDKLAGRAIG